MLDIKFIKENPEAVKSVIKKRFRPDSIKFVDEAILIYDKWRDLKQEGDILRQKRNYLSEEINRLKKEGRDFREKIAEIKEIPVQIKKLEQKDAELQSKLRELLKKIPNLLDKSVPIAETEKGNKTVRTFGKRPKYKFKLRSHVDLIQELDLADIERAAKVSGARFYYLKNELVELDSAVLKFALDTLKKNKYTLIRTPDLLKKEMMEGAAELGDFEETLYKIDGDDLFLVGTAEHTLASLHSGEILDNLPLKYAGISECFRREAGAHGKDTKGIFRV
ncbi:MAG: aminoacyl--tRNA ligase-related protein, partial [Nanoarchaeota archaeon]